MLLQTFPSGPLSTNAYVIACEATHEAAIIDPAPQSASQIFDYLSKHQLKAKQILLTHSHWDHIADVAPLREMCHALVAVHFLDLPNLVEPGADGLPCWLDIPSVQPDLLLEEGMKINVGQLSIEVIHIPGHSAGSVCFYLPTEEVLFSGDTLFKGSMGNISFPTSQPKLMWNSLAKLAELPKQTKVYPGHGPSTTIGAESWLNSAEEIWFIR